MGETLREHDAALRERETQLLRAVGEAIRDQSSATPPAMPLACEPADPPTADMRPVADAVDRMTQTLATQSQLIGKLIEALARQPAAVIKIPDRNGRRIRVKHDDGTESIITEE